MRSILMIVTIITMIGCSKNTEGGGESSNSTTLTPGKESSIIAPPSEELKAQGYNDQYVKIANTKYPDYAEYHKEWKRINNDSKTTYTLPKKTEEPVEMNLSDLSFREAFNLQYRAHGEGHIFWWRGNEYTTNVSKD